LEKIEKLISEFRDEQKSAIYNLTSQFLKNRVN
jgi:hypothetical protein